MLEKEVLDNIVNEITDNYHSEELFYLKSGHCMPNRDTITPVSYTHLDVYKRQGLTLAEKLVMSSFFMPYIFSIFSKSLP